ncbi:MAG TPA: class I SAM-dependent methyltransferase [Acidimicrobiales bacterium]
MSTIRAFTHGCRREVCVIPSTYFERAVSDAADPACPICRSPMRPAGSKHATFSGREFNLHQCRVCWFARVAEPCTDFEHLYDANYYRGRGADPLTDYEAEISDPSTVRRHEWEGILRIVTSLHDVGPHSHWLDLGCGLGGLVRHLRDQGFEHAIGSDDGHARNRALELGVQCLSTSELDEIDARFDVITSIEVIEHIIDPMPFVTNVARLLRPGGLFFFTTGNARRHRDDLASWPYVIPEIHVSFFEPHTMERALRNAGLVPEYHGFVPGYEDVIRYKTLKHLPERVRHVADRFTPWSRVAPLIDRWFGVSAFPVGRKPTSPSAP